VRWYAGKVPGQRVAENVRGVGCAIRIMVYGDDGRGVTRVYTGADESYPEGSDTWDRRWSNEMNGQRCGEFGKAKSSAQR